MSPVMLFNIIDVELAEGGTMVTLTTVEPPVGRVTVLKPLASVLISIEPGDDALEPALSVSVPTTSPVYVSVAVRVAVTAI